MRNYLLRHLQAGLNSLGQFTRAPITSLVTCLVIGITLALPTALFVILKNAENIRGSFQQTTQFTLYLKKDVSESQANALTHKLQNRSEIEKAYTISPEEGLVELQQQAGFQGILEELKDNPLPWTIIIIPHTAYDTADALNKLTDSLKQLPEVDNLQMDMLWVKRLGTLIFLAKRMVLAFTILLGAAVLLIVNTTIRSATQNNQKEIAVIKLIGGTNAFIRRPFLYAGALYGLLGSIIAWQLIDILLLLLRSPVGHLAKLYNNSFSLIGLGLNETLLLLVGSVVLGLLGSWLAVTRHLALSDPTP
jgi:cell division transport system permease protein